MARAAHDPKKERLDDVAALIRKRVAGEEVKPAEAFARAFLAGVAAEDLIESSAATLFGAALSLWAFLKKRPHGGAPRVRAYNPTMEEHGWLSTHTIVEIVTDDMPFLVDSTANALNQLDLTVHLLIHPIVRVRRDGDGKLAAFGAEAGPDATAESVQHVQVTRQVGAERLKEIERRVAEVLASVRHAVEDWRPSIARIDAIVKELGDGPPPLAADEIAEGKAFLQWLRDDHFLFLGAREYRLVRRDGKDFSEIVEGSGLGVLREVTGESLERHGKSLPPLVAKSVRRKSLLMITKATSRSRVHRPVYMDYIGIRRFGADGDVVGEHRFLGLLTSAAYNRNPREIPLLRRKVALVFERSGFAPNSHNGKALQNIIEAYPRDELFQIDDEALTETALGILHLEERQRIRLFVRRDSYARFFSCQVFVPRDRYTTELREKMQGILMQALEGDAVEFSTQVSEAPMARIHFMVHTPRDTVPTFDVATIEAQLVAVSRAWSDDLRDALVEAHGEGRGSTEFQRYRKAFPAAYPHAFDARVAVADIERIEGLGAGDGIAMSLYRRVNAPEDVVHFKVYHAGEPVPMSDILPMLENMGLRVIEETPFLVEPFDGPRSVWIHDFSLRTRGGHEVDLGTVRAGFQDAFARVWSGEVEDDRFNQLVIGAGLTWREVVVLRALSKYLRQAGIAFSQSYMRETFNNNRAIARLLVELFSARMDPDAGTGRAERLAALKAAIAEALDKVQSLDEDRILRRFLNVIEAMLRTNYFQADALGQPKPYVSFKFDSKALDELPEPRPLREIWVYSPRVEAVHMRFGLVARGGIRWSDRREDFRTEVLGLVKAQQVKNAVIVPVGAKGGFVVKRPPAGGREALLEEGIACYRTMMAGLLDVTDNLDAGAVVPPARVVRYDGDDPYLVVAADKGTATFSDIANGIALERGFWLGDAFASGGSAGYDHKKMAITARGAWEAVKRHFREIGKDIQSEDFTVVGIGDMSGDVFGNGMLLSRHIRLIGAFDHRHIFLDPDPDAAKSFAERERLFALARSSWADYDAALLSEGGGVHDRKAKSIAVTPQVALALDIDKKAVTPNEMMRAILRARVDLLWNGGIGTYVKASRESHAAVGDRANDALRVDARELRAKVVGEGGNLGFTQLGRVEYAQAGGRLNSDAIDNSAGVDCSDHEVNIKILLNDVVSAGDMTRKQRDELLAAMTDEVAALVLRDNYQQTQALSLMEAQGTALMESQARLMRALESRKLLDRAIECLPNDEELGERQAKGRGLTRPELAVLLAYAKMAAYDALLASDVPEDTHFASDLALYFPKPVRKRFAPAVARHRLRREIIATAVTNSLINRAGGTFLYEMIDRTGFDAAAVARAFTAARDTYDLREVWRAVEALDTKVAASAQTDLLIEAGRLLERATLWFLRNEAQPIDVGATVALYGPGVTELLEAFDVVVGETRKRAMADAAAKWVEAGIPRELAERVARLRTLAAVGDIARTARREERGTVDVGRVYFALGSRLGFDWLRQCAAKLKPETHWQRLAIQALFDDSHAQQRALAAAVVKSNGATGAESVAAWVDGHKKAVARADQLLGDLKAAGGVDLAMLTVANRHLALLAAE
ncbi:MAG: NAD-glutamate dehydrogenase [Alphaproteobacteria bacterium]